LGRINALLGPYMNACLRRPVGSWSFQVVTTTYQLQISPVNCVIIICTPWFKNTDLLHLMTN